MAIAPTHEQVLSVWEQGINRHPIDRALLMYSMASPEKPHDALAEAPLGVRNATLYEFRECYFNSPLTAWIDCSACGERMTVELDRTQLPQHPSGTQEAVEIRGQRFHLVNSRHLASMAVTMRTEGRTTATQQLLINCAESIDALPADTTELECLSAEVEVALDEADPWADLSVMLECPACDQQTEANLDIAEFLWDEIDSLAQGLLDDIHSLAAAYGWTEQDILALSHQRRHAYIARLPT